MKIVVDRAIPYLDGLLEEWAEVVYMPGREIAPADVQDADALLVRTRTRCDGRLLAGSRVRFIGTATIGFDHIDLDFCARNGIRVAAAAGCNARGVLQYIGAVLVALSQREGWRPEERTLGVVGVGHVGSLVADYAQAWGFRVLRCDPPRQLREGLPDYLPLDRVARQADLLTFHTPLDAVTRHMADGDLFSRMPAHGTVINTSRGEVVQGEALLESGLRFVLDVWEHEPDIDRRLLRQALFATPHIAGYSAQGKANAAAMVVRSLSRCFGLPLTEWYPDRAPLSTPRPIGWQELCSTMERYFDLEAQSAALKRAPGDFERMRDGYRYRTEYF